jgi:signal peptide peptidase SppA
MLTNLIANPGSLAATLPRYGRVWAVDDTYAQARFAELCAVDAAVYLAAYHSAVARGERKAVSAFPKAGLFVGEDGSDGWNSTDANGARRRGKRYQMDGNVAVLEMNGEMTREETSWGDGVSTLALQRQFRAARRDPDVHSAAWVINSPGGSVDGVDELWQDATAFAKDKPLYAFVTGMCASAGMYAASAANQIYAHRASMNGSLGVYSYLYDLSKAAEAQGVSVKMYRDGALKGAGVPGTTITEEMDKEFQAIVDGYGKQFRSAFRTGRNAAGKNFTAEQVDALFDGRIHFAEKARDLGMIDGVTTLDRMMSKLKNYRPG